MEIAALYKEMAYTSMYMSEIVFPLRLASFFTRHLQKWQSSPTEIIAAQGKEIIELKKIIEKIEECSKKGLTVIVYELRISAASGNGKISTKFAGTWCRKKTAKK